MEEESTVYVGLDVAKAIHAVALAESGRQGEVRFIGEIMADPASVRRLVARLGKKHSRLRFCCEAGPTGYGLYRQLTDLGHQCSVVAPSMIPRKPGDRVKTNRRDAIQLARLLRAGCTAEIKLGWSLVWTGRRTLWRIISLSTKFPPPEPFDGPRISRDFHTGPA